MKAYDSDRADPKLVRTSLYGNCNNNSLQVLHCEDGLSDNGITTFREFTDHRIGPPELNLLMLLHIVAKNATKRHSIRSTAAEVSYIYS